MNVYDFDKTIYKGDSTVDFYFFLLRRHRRLALLFPHIIWSALLWAVGVTDKTGFKESFYKFLTKIDDIDSELEVFWNEHQYKIKHFYKAQQKEDDVVISASPEFLLKPVADRLGIKYLYASRVDKKTGKYTGENCWGEEKTKRFYEAFGKSAKIDEFYSDSLSDTPLADIAEKSFIVSGYEMIPWNEYKPKKKSVFLSREFLLFLLIGVVNTLNGVLFSLVYSLFAGANMGFVLGYITALSVAYLLNTWIIFREEAGIKRYIKFCISYIPNFLIQNISVIIFYNILSQDKLIAYALAAVIGIPVTFLIVKVFAFGKSKD